MKDVTMQFPLKTRSMFNAFEFARKCAYQFQDITTVTWSLSESTFVVFTQENHEGVLDALSLYVVYQFHPFERSEV